MNIRTTEEVPHPNYVLVDSQRKYEDLLQSVRGTSRLSFDYETSADKCESYLTLNKRQQPVIDYPRSRITSASFRCSDGKCYYISIDHKDSFNFPGGGNSNYRHGFFLTTLNSRCSPSR